jgi:hypothetical protein
MNSKDTSSKKQGKSSVENSNISNKNVTHTDHRSKTKSNNGANDTTDDYKYTPGADRLKSGALKKETIIGNIRGV